MTEEQLKLLLHTVHVLGIWLGLGSHVLRVLSKVTFLHQGSSLTFFVRSFWDRSPTGQGFVATAAVCLLLQILSTSLTELSPQVLKLEGHASSLGFAAVKAYVPEKHGRDVGWCWLAFPTQPQPY